ncbi:helix-turn-helix domain-containing protein [Joostella sp.]|uniref:helix-turn-helix domain-containing protein n=1 Tax=Joostella sp. TaxID=2231138 RepID=UPI003A92741C
MNAHTEQRLQQIHQLLLELSKGNFNYRIALSENNDELEALVTLLNMTVEEIQDSFLHQGYIALDDSYTLSQTALFVLNRKGVIKYSNTTGHNLLQYKGNDLIGISFERLLHKRSKTWKKFFKGLWKQEISPPSTFKMLLNTKERLLLPVYGSIIFPNPKYIKKGNCLLTFTVLLKERKVLENELTKKIKDSLKKATNNKATTSHTTHLFSEDIHKIRSIGNKIEKQPATHIPNLKTLAVENGLNEFKLKRGFKQLYGMTVLQFQKNERLRNAHTLAQNTDTSVKLIAQQLGFKKANHFSREFKKRFGYSVRELRTAQSLQKQPSISNNPS